MEASGNLPDKPVEEKPPNGRGGRRWLKLEPLKPSDLINIGAAAIAVIAVYLTVQSAKDDIKQEIRQENEAAPVLIASAAPDAGGQPIVVYPTYGPAITKPADQLYVEPLRGSGARIVMPIRNVGLGVASVYGRPMILTSCAPRSVAAAVHIPVLQGTYVLESGETDQLGFLQPPPANVPGGEWHYYDYRLFTATKRSSLHMLIRYQDVAGTTIDWTCAKYIFGSRMRTRHRGTLWTTYAEYYSKPPF